MASPLEHKKAVAEWRLNGGAYNGSPKPTQRLADAPIKAKVAQNFVMDEGLWSDDAKQKELF